MNSVKEFLIRIKLMMTGRGGADAKESLDQAEQSADSAGRSLDQADKSAESAAGSLENLGTGAGEARRGLDKTAASARAVGREMKGAADAATPGPFRRFFLGIREGAARSRAGIAKLTTAFRGLIALAGIGGIGFMTRSMMELAESVERNAQVAGTNNRAWQRAEFATTQNKASADDLREALHQLNLRAVQNVETFEKWGIATKDANGAQRDSIDILRDIADRMQNAATAGERAALANETMERTGRRLIPLLRQGSAAFDALGDKAEAAGQVMEDKAIRQLNDAKDSLAAFGRQATIATAKVVVGFQQMGKAIGEGIAGVAFGGITPEEFDAIEARKRAIRELQEEGKHDKMALDGTLPIPLWGARQRRELAEAQEAVENRINEILNEQTQQKIRQAQANQAAANEEAKRAEMAAHLEKEAEIHARIAQIREMFADEEEAANFQRLSNVEKLLVLEERIGKLKREAMIQGDLEAAEALIVLEREREMILTNIADQKERAADAQEREASRQKAATADLLAEFQILQARAHGNEALATHLEQEHRVRTDVQRIVEQTGLSEQQVEAYVRRRLHLEQQIAATKREQTQESGKETDEIENQVSEKERLWEIARRDIEGRTVEGRQARDKLIKEGHLSRDQNERERQLLDSPPAQSRAAHTIPSPIPSPPMPDNFDNRPITESLDRQGSALGDFMKAVAERNRSLIRGIEQITRAMESAASGIEHLNRELSDTNRAVESIHHRLKNVESIIRNRG